MSCADHTREDFAELIQAEGQPVEILVTTFPDSVHDVPALPVVVDTFAIIGTIDIKASANVPALASARFTALLADDPAAFGASAAVIRTASGTSDGLRLRWGLTGGAVTDQPQEAAMVAVLARASTGGELFKHKWALGGAA